MLFRILLLTLLTLIGATVISLNSTSSENNTDSILNGLDLVKSWFADDTETGSQPQETVVYKWKDADGTWQFANEPPPEGTAHGVKIYRSDVNVTSAVKPEPSPAAEPSPESTAESTPPIGDAFMPITNPTRVQKLIEDAKNVQQLADERQRSLEQ